VNELGQRTNDYVAGIYTFGSILGTEELIFIPFYNAFNPSEPGRPARLTLAAGATANRIGRGTWGTVRSGKRFLERVHPGN
jgi:hypothetical protein